MRLVVDTGPLIALARPATSIWFLAFFDDIVSNDV